MKGSRLLPILFFGLCAFISAQDLSVSGGAGLFSRYIWRGLNVNDAVNIQPSITLEYSGFSAGFWGSYAFTSTEETNGLSQEIDAWVSYSLEFQGGLRLSAIATDYYYPLGGIRYSNFHNYNDEEGPGAHTVETGLGITGPENFPMTFSAYINVYNDAGNNTYFQLDYPFAVKDFSLNFFIGAAGGSLKILITMEQKSLM